mgnify:CR=1 FL=1|tara:strand:+ start:425 stop:538 length:114 start_codon:yes stop_codon:yes gene_type:complete
MAMTDARAMNMMKNYMDKNKKKGKKKKGYGGYGKKKK